MKLQVQTIGARALLLAVLSIGLPHSMSGLTIIRDYVGGAPATNAAGAGTLVAIFNAAADLWELAIQDQHVLTLHYGWAPITGSMANHVTVKEAGNPVREIEGRILFDNDNLSPVQFYLDPTPYQSEEYQSYHPHLYDFGGGVLNASHHFVSPVGLAVDRADVLSMALHEIGHALGLTVGGAAWTEESQDRHIDITSPLPYPGTSIPLATNAFGVTTHFDPFSYAGAAVMGGITGGERRLLSVIDILADAQLSQFTNLNLDLAPVLRSGISAQGLVLTWSAFAADFRLEHTPLFGSQTNWLPANCSVATNGGQCSALLPASASSDFVRLRKPGPRWP